MRLKQERTKRKMSRYALAKKAGVDQGYLRKLEDGRSSPTVEMLQKLADALKVSIVTLLK